MTADPYPLFAEFNRGVERARRAYHDDSPRPRPYHEQRTCACGRGLRTEAAKCWVCRKRKA